MRRSAGGMRMNRSKGTAARMQIRVRMSGTPRRWWRALSVGVAAHLFLGVGIITGVNIHADGWRATGTWSEGQDVIGCALAVSLILALALLLTHSVRLARQDVRCASAIRHVRRLPSLRLLQAATGLVPTRRLFELDDERPFAGCIGLWRPAVYISGGLIDQADPSALRAAVAHEASHLRRRDPLRLAAGRLVAWLLLPPPWRSGVVERLELRSEVLADRFASAQVSTAALASVLLHVARAHASLPPASASRAAQSHLYSQLPPSCSTGRLVMRTSGALQAGRSSMNASTVSPHHPAPPCPALFRQQFAGRASVASWRTGSPTPSRLRLPLRPCACSRG